MALLFRIGLPKSTSSGLCVRLCKALQINTTGQVACISGKAIRELTVNKKDRPDPFPYLEKEFRGWVQMTDPMLGRFDENSKIIVVEGPIAAGKNKFAKKLAEELDMAYFPPETFDNAYINPYGFDYRSLNPKLSPAGQFIDVEMFLQNPYRAVVPAWHRQFYHLQYNQYITALLHILSTGEGVVLTRSFLFSIAFIKAAINAGYIPERVLGFYQREQENMLQCILKPHLIVYLDVPVDEVKERIKKRNIPYEVNSKVLTTQYLTDIERVCKEEVLPKLTDHTHILQYDATNEVDVQDVVWDIEDLDFEASLDKTKMRDWLFNTTDELVQLRAWYDKERDHLSDSMILHEIEEDLMAPAEDMAVIHHALENEIPEEKYAPGFNKLMGDSYLFRHKFTMLDELKMQEETLQRLGKKKK